MIWRNGLVGVTARVRRVARRRYGEKESGNGERVGPPRESRRAATTRGAGGSGGVGISGYVCDCGCGCGGREGYLLLVLYVIILDFYSC